MRVYAPSPARRECWRLRSGRVCRIYQQHGSPTGNIRALVRAAVRRISAATSQFDAVRRTIMTTVRDGKALLQTEVREMRRAGLITCASRSFWRKTAL